MALREQVLGDIKTAMKAKDATRLTTLRMLQSAIKNKEIDLRPNEISDADILAVVKKLVKQRQDSSEQYEKAGRADLLEKEQAEILILETYLPKQLSEAELTNIVGDVIVALGASSMKDMGAIMKEVMAKTGGAADNKMISSLVKAKLS